MTHIGILCPARIGHLNPMCNVGHELQQRGHKVTLFGLPDTKEKIAKSRLGFYKVGAQDFPRGTLEVLDNQVSKLSGINEIRFSINISQKATRMMFREAPDALRNTGVEFLLVDQVTFSGGTIADYLRLPFITICNGLPLNQEPNVPPSNTLWAYRKVWWATLRNQFGHQMLRYLTRPIWKLIVEQREQWKLTAYHSRENAYSPLAQICQFPEVLDFPRENLPPWFHYVGSLKNPSGVEPIYSDNQNFSFEIVEKKKLVYASLGTLHNRDWKIFRTISEACLELDVQLVIDLGNPMVDTSKADFPGAIVLPFAPHQKIINRASLVITHAGSTVINCLQAGVPMVAIPITNDHPGIAARVARVGACEVVPLGNLSVTTLRACIEKVLFTQSYQNNAVKLSAEIQKSGGVFRAADIIEQAIKTKAPVLGT
ncbi:glycosyl transferase family 1 [filamentous cyanobacterium CCP3]|nr:glycosyl transferase family 1 [filamentous cyanobacterium CCP3]